MKKVKISKVLKSNIKLLKEYESSGFVFHGSSNGNIDVLELRQAWDAKQKKVLMLIKLFLQLHLPLLVFCSLVCLEILFQRR